MPARILVTPLLATVLAACALLPTPVGRRTARTDVPALVLATDAPRFLVAGHRGDYFAEPFENEGNTMRAFASAHAAGADLLEVDVEATADGRPVVAHDSWPRERAFAAWEAAGRRPLPLEEVLRWAAGRIVLVLDVKTADVGAIADLLRREGAVDRVIVFASDEPEVRAVRAVGADLYLMVRAHSAEEADAWGRRPDPRVVIVHGDFDWLSPEVVARIRATGRRVWANSYRESWHGELLGAGETADRLFARGIDVVQTNDPASAARARDRRLDRP